MKRLTLAKNWRSDEAMKRLTLHRIASSLHRFIASLLHRFIASLLHRFIASSLHRYCCPALLLEGLQYSSLLFFIGRKIRDYCYTFCGQFCTHFTCFCFWSLLQHITDSVLSVERLFLYSKYSNKFHPTSGNTLNAKCYLINNCFFLVNVIKTIIKNNFFYNSLLSKFNKTKSILTIFINN
jgi:hypothetical protein